MKVVAILPHQNGYGAPYQKVKGTIYDHPNPQHLIDSGLVKKHENKSKVRGRKAAGRSAAGVQDIDSKSGGETSGEKGTNSGKE